MNANNVKELYSLLIMTRQYVLSQYKIANQDKLTQVKQNVKPAKLPTKFLKINQMFVLRHWVNVKHPKLFLPDRNVKNV